MSKSINPVSAKNELIDSRSLISKNTPLLSIIVLVLLSICVYSPVFTHQFQMYWDDQWVVINVYSENGINKYNLWAILTEFYHGQYAPLNQLSYTLLYSLFGYNPFWFHTFGILIHIGNVILVYFIIQALLIQVKDFDDKSTQRISFLTAIIMAVHPFLVESVAWLAASKILIYAFFYLLAIHYYLKFTATNQIKYYLLVILLFIFSFGGKEQAVTLPVCLLLIDYTLKRDFRSRAVWLEKIPLFVLAIFFGYITMLSQSVEGSGVLSKAPHYPFYQNIIFASYSIMEYLIKCLIPIKLSYLYPFPNQIAQQVPLRFWIYPGVLLFIFLSLFDFWKKKWVSFGIIFFLIHLGVVLHIIPISRFTIIADRYAYIASIGIFFLISYFLNQTLSIPKYKNLIITLYSVYIIILGLYAHQHSKVWHNSDTLKKELKDLIQKRNDFQISKPKK